MDFDAFCKKICAAMQEYMAGTGEVVVTDILKNNGIVLKGLLVRKTGVNVTPTIYLEQLYAGYNDGTCMADIMRTLIDRFESSSETSIDMGYYSDYEKVKDRIILKLVNYDMNKALLDDVPYIKWNDLAIVFCHLVADSELDQATVLIRSDHLKMWKKTEDEIYRQACVNTPLLMGDELKTIGSILKEMAVCSQNEDIPEEYLDEDGCCGDIHMYVLSNRRRIFGAAAMLYSDDIARLAEYFGADMYIIPSSIHEVLLIPESSGVDEEYMRDMIHEVNATQVAPEERLSDTLYYFDRDNREIRMSC